MSGRQRGQTVLQQIVLWAVGTYQAARSGHPSPCRFYPSCSNYALEAVALHGAWRGTGLALRRLARCHPLGGRGIDLVPTAKTAPGAPTPAVISRGARS